VDAKGKETIVCGENIVIAVGGRPRYPQVKFELLVILNIFNSNIAAPLCTIMFYQFN